MKNNLTYVACLSAKNDLNGFEALKKQLPFSYIYCYEDFAFENPDRKCKIVSLDKIMRLKNKQVVIFNASYSKYEEIHDKLKLLDIPSVHSAVYLKTTPAFYEMKDLANYKKADEKFIDAGNGNRIIFGSVPTGNGVIVFNGRNNLVQLGKGCCFYRRAYLRTNGNGNKIILGAGVKSGNTEVLAGNQYGLSIFATGKTTISIGSFATIGGAMFRGSEGGTIEVGPNCMFSWDINIWQTQGHMLCDMNQNGERINLNKNITLGSHVWVGKSATILSGAEIGSNCVVGYGALVTGGTFPDHCTLAGVPARKGRENICWARDFASSGITNIHDCKDQEGLKIWQAQHADEEKTE